MLTERPRHGDLERGSVRGEICTAERDSGGARYLAANARVSGAGCIRSELRDESLNR